MSEPSVPQEPRRARQEAIAHWLTETEHWASQLPQIEAVAVVGSTGNVIADDLSDISLVVFGTDWEELPFDSLSPSHPRFLSIRAHERLTLYLNNPLLRVTIVAHPCADLEHWVNQKRDSASLSGPSWEVVYDRTGALTGLRVRMASPGRGRDLLPDGALQALDFMDGFERFHAAYHRGEVYRAMELEQRAFRSIVLFLAAQRGIEGHSSNLDLLLDELPESLGNRVRMLAPTKDIDDGLHRIRDLYTIFLGELQSGSPLPSVSVDSAKKLREFVTLWFPPFLRWRDIAMPPVIAQGRVYRASQLEKAEPLEILGLLKSYNIQTVVDLRTEEELKDFRYPLIIGKVAQYRSIPFVARVEPPLPASESRRRVDGMEHFYKLVAAQQAFHRTVRSLFSVLSDVSRYPILIHCQAGVDRTGMLVALIHSLAGAPDEMVESEYLSVGAHVRRRYIQAFMSSLRQGGGVRSYLTAIGIGPDVTERTLRNLRSPDFTTGNLVADSGLNST